MCEICRTFYHQSGGDDGGCRNPNPSKAAQREKTMAATYTHTLVLVPTAITSSYSNSRKPIYPSISLLLPQTLNKSFRSIQPISIPSPLKTTRRRPQTIIFMLPTAKPDGASANKIRKWSARGIKAFGMGELEARKLKYPTTGTEALLMGILVEGTSEAAKFLRTNGITLFKVREETVNLLGKSDMYFFSPEHPPLTEPAQRALDWAVDEKMKSGEGGEVNASHMLLGIWSEEDSAGHKILTTLGFDDEKARELAKNADKEAVMNHK